jgi:peptide methionine sulfoxide reductase MsrB
MGEYERLTKERRNDVIELFFTALSERAILVKKSTLSRQHYQKAKGKCGWPGHDQHLIAAAIGGTDPHIVVTEQMHVKCAACVLKSFAIHIEYLG